MPAVEQTVPDVSVVVPAHNAATTVERTIAALDAQRFEGIWEIVLVDDASTDATVERAEAVGSSRLRVVKGPGQGAGAARNAGVAAARAALLAFTDADCRPQPDWLAVGAEMLSTAELIQGKVEPDPAQPLGPFDRTLWVEGERGLYETANLFVRRELYESVGGFDDWLRIGGRPFAEDIWFGWRARRTGARTAFAPQALVHHEVFPRGASGYVAERWRTHWFPAIARQIPEFRRQALYRRVFLSRRSAAFDLALAGAAVARRARTPLPLLAAAPYMLLLARDVQPYRRRAPLVAAVRSTADGLSFFALVTGSARWRSPVL